MLIPPAVAGELHLDSDLPGNEALRGAIHGGWIVPATLRSQSLSAILRRELDQGESEAIALADEINAERLLLDERDARLEGR